jgi:hypothetical protein
MASSHSKPISGTYDFRALLIKVEDDRRRLRDNLRAELEGIKATVATLEAQHEEAYRRQLDLEKVAVEIDLDAFVAEPSEHDTIPAPPPTAPAAARRSSAPAAFDGLKQTVASDLILQIVNDHPTGLTAMEIARRVRLIRPELKVDSVTSQVYTLRSANKLVATKPQGGPRIFRPVHH